MLVRSFDSASLKVELFGDNGSHTLEGVCLLRSTLEAVGGCRPTNEAPCVGGLIAASSHVLAPIRIFTSVTTTLAAGAAHSLHKLPFPSSANGERSISRSYVECFQLRTNSDQFIICQLDSSLYNIHIY